MNIAAAAWAGFAPILVIFALMAGLRWSAARAMGVGWVLASALGLLLWRMEPGWWAAAALLGTLQAMEISVIVFGAMLLMNHLEGSGAIAAIRRHLTRISPDRRVQLLLIGLGFTTLIEGAAGFGTPGALAAPLLLGLGFPPIAAAVFGLFFNGLQPPLGAVGTPVLGGIGSVVGPGVLSEQIAADGFLRQVAGWTGSVTGGLLTIWGLVGVFFLLLWFGRPEERNVTTAWRGTRQVAPFALLLGAVTGATQCLVAWLTGPELPNIVAGFAALGVGVLLARKGVLTPARPWDFAEAGGWPDGWLGGLDAPRPDGADRGSPMPLWLAWTPYALVALLLLLTRLPSLGWREALRAPTLHVPRLLGQELPYTLRYLYLPGLLPFIPVAVLTGWLHRMDRSSVAAAWRRAGRQIRPVALTLIVAVSMSQVMIRSATNPAGQPGMMEALSRALADRAGGALALVAPWLGALGAFMTGSSTSSNILFAALQHDAAAAVGLSRTLVVALQNVGSGVGNMTSVLNIAAVSGVLGLRAREGDLLRRLLVPTAILLALVGLAGVALTGLVAGVY